MKLNYLLKNSFKNLIEPIPTEKGENVFCVKVVKFYSVTGKTMNT